MVDLMAGYAQALTLTESMLTAARNSEWDRLVQIEIERGRLFEQLRSADQNAPESDESVIRRRETIEIILARDEEIKLLTQDWMHELRDILGSATAQRLLNRTYTP